MIAPDLGRATLEKLGWTIEERKSHLLARLEHRQIVIYKDGRVEFRDPTIRARYQLDADWLRVSANIWPDVRL
jgi:hypothetical protein